MLLAAGLAARLDTAEERPEAGLLFFLSGDKGTTADFSAANTPEANFVAEITPIRDGAKGTALRCGDHQLLCWWAPGNIQAQRGTLAFFWRARDPAGPTEFPLFRVGYADHSSWDMVWLRIDYNGHGFDAFVTDASLARTRVSVTIAPFPKPDEWTHLALCWDETRGIRFYVNGKPAAKNETIAVYDAALDQFGPHSRIISPYQVQSEYNFVRGGDVDEIRIYDRMLDDAAVAALAKGDAPSGLAPAAARDLADPRWRDEWWRRYGWNRPDDRPPPLPDGPFVSVRKVEIHDAYDLKRWWWKANDGIRETTWPGVYNRSRLPGRNDYFQLPDWDCYSVSGRSITFIMPDEPWNHLEISGAAWGKLNLLTDGEETILFSRPKGQEKTAHQLAVPIRGKKIRFDNVEPEEPIGELSVYNVTAGREPAGRASLAYRLTAFAEVDAPSLGPLYQYIHGRHAPDERSTMVALPPASVPAPTGPPPPSRPGTLPLVHVLIPNSWEKMDGGLDGVAFDLPALKAKPTHGGLIALNLRVKDPLWPLRDMLDFSFSVKPGAPKTLWLDLRDRMLPPGKALYLTIAGAGAEFGPTSLEGAALRLVFKPREAARAEHEPDRFTQARDSYAMLVEERPDSPKFNLWNRFKGDLVDLLRVNPEHRLGRLYAAAAWDAPRPAFTQPEPPPGVPLWAFRQVELLGRVKRFVNWYIDQRQIENGELGGGLSDDTDLTNTWPGVALMGCEPDKVAASLRRVLDACYTNGMFTRGLPTIQADELHCYEEGINGLAQNLILDYGSPTQLERAMETARGIESITGVNTAGHRHIRSSYYSGTKLAEDGPWGWSKPHSYLVLQVPQLLVDYNGSPAAKKYLLELADGLLAHRRAGDGGRASLPGSIHFATDRTGDATRNYFPWHLFWGGWKWTGDRKYLDPILDGGLTSLTAVNANALDLLSLRDDWNRLVDNERAGPNETVRAAGSRTTSMSHFTWQLNGDKRLLENLYARQIEGCAAFEYINTEGSLWIDRVGVPSVDLQRARLGGVALVRGGLYPGHVVSWRFAAPDNDQSVAILIPDATPAHFKVIAYNLETAPVRAAMTGWNVDPGIWEVTQGVDRDGDDKADGEIRTSRAEFERTRSVNLIFAPRAATILTFTLKTPGTPYWQRPDLGIDRDDVAVNGREVRVRVHSLGAVSAPASVVTVRGRDGRVLASADVVTLAAPDDLRPRTAEVTLRLPAGAEAAGGMVEIDPDHRLGEITTVNNAVKL
ncbi:MAG: hypothetical protein A3G75_06750 [Verrucomicrobia bacterium RIFCSPLOWO2_12_FULL_64_8]|nr:MAG: hypothetical protein A3G75_06750 [Verrucomicrobia bacterium RIFCSPLOWO2_12_FULL_64_8]